MKSIRHLLSLAVFIALCSATAWADDIPGIYTLCERKNPENCPQAVADFRRAFPNDQTGAFLFIRVGGTGYLAPDGDRTFDFQWLMTDPATLVLDMADQDQKSLKFQVDGPLLRNAATGELYHLAITDAEWNNPPAKRPSVKR